MPKVWNAIARAKCALCDLMIEPGQPIARFAPHPLPGASMYRHPHCKVQFQPYSGNEGGCGYAGPFISNRAAEAVLRRVQAKGNAGARISAHSSMVMTSDNSPIILNVKAEELGNAL